jgi:hypothetical protein
MSSVRSTALPHPSPLSGRSGSRLCENSNSESTRDEDGGLRPSGGIRRYERDRPGHWRFWGRDLGSGREAVKWWLGTHRSARKSGRQARAMAMIKGRAPRTRITRLRLYARTWRFISVLTRGNVRVRKWVCPIQAFRVPKGCSTVHRRTRMRSGCWSRRRSAASTTASCSQRLTRR